MNLKKNRRKGKRYINHMLKKLRFGMYVVDCRYHPCLIIEQNHWDEDFAGKSLLNDTTISCSIYHCGPLPISKEEAYARRDFIRAEGWEAYLVKYEGYTEEALVEHRKLNAVWNFDQGEVKNVE